MDSTLILATPSITSIYNHLDSFTSSDSSVNNPSDSDILTPLTSPSQPGQEGGGTYFDLSELLNPENSLNINLADLVLPEQVQWSQMAPSKSGNSSSFGSYNDSYQNTGISQERSTVSPPGQTSTSESFPWPPKQPSEPTPPPPNHGLVHNMLPPLRPTQETSLPSTQYWFHHQSSTYGAYPQAYQYPQYPTNYKSHVQHIYTPSHNHGNSHSSHPPPIQTYGYPSPLHPASSSSTSEAFTHPTTATQYYPSGTIQPSAFGGWHHGDFSRERESTVSGSLTGEDLIHNRLAERPSSSASLGELSEIEVKQEQKSMLSPDSVGRSTLSDEDHTPAPPPPVELMIREGSIIYTVDSEVKQTPEIKRMCYNCQAKSPPSWRKSVLNVGKILCNKCGIFERTHHRARPPQNDDQKLRKTNGIPYGRGTRDIPSLQSMRDGHSPLRSPYSTVPSQATPYSAPGFSYSHQQNLHLETMSPNSGGNFQANSSSHRRYPQSHAYGHQTSPYAHAYARRAAGSATGQSSSLPRSPYSAPHNAGLPTSGAHVKIEDDWDTGRRHSGTTTSSSSPE